MYECKRNDERHRKPRTCAERERADQICHERQDREDADQSRRKEDSEQSPIDLPESPDHLARSLRENDNGARAKSLSANDISGETARRRRPLTNGTDLIRRELGVRMDENIRG